MKFERLVAATLAFMTALTPSTAFADPCGMVPPLFLGQGTPIERIGLQKTYVFFKNGIETFVIRPGFQGQVDECPECRFTDACSGVVDKVYQVTQLVGSKASFNHRWPPSQTALSTRLNDHYDARISHDAHHASYARPV